MAGEGGGEGGGGWPRVRNVNTETGSNRGGKTVSHAAAAGDQMARALAKNMYKNIHKKMKQEGVD